jgi:hypothetical protein
MENFLLQVLVGLYRASHGRILNDHPCSFQRFFQKWLTAHWSGVSGPVRPL